MKENTASYFANEYGSEKLKQSTEQLEANIAKDDFHALKFDVVEIKKSREKFFYKKRKSKNNPANSWINP